MHPHISPPPAPPDRWNTLRRFAQSPPRQRLERCELCSLPLGPEHAHLIDDTHQILCACEPCAILFSQHARQRYRRVPRDVHFLADFRLDDLAWNALDIPVGLAFFVRRETTGRVEALYPSPAGATKSLLDVDAWDDLVRDNPVLASLEPDTQALLVNRVAEAREHFLAPIDQCYRLVGLVRTQWRGLSGGADVWRHIAEFFLHLRQRAE